MEDDDEVPPCKTFAELSEWMHKRYPSMSNTPPRSYFSKHWIDAAKPREVEFEEVKPRALPEAKET